MVKACDNECGNSYTVAPGSIDAGFVLPVRLVLGHSGGHYEFCGMGCLVQFLQKQGYSMPRQEH